MDQVLPLLKHYLKDVQESIRAAAADALIGVVQGFPARNDSCFQHTNETLVAASEDKSWRVRLAVVTGRCFCSVAMALRHSQSRSAPNVLLFFLVLGGLPSGRLAGLACITKGFPIAQSEFVTGPGGLLARALEDGEAEVRVAAVKAVVPVGQQTGGDALIPTIIPLLMELTSDAVRLMVARATEAPHQLPRISRN